MKENKAHKDEKDISHSVSPTARREEEILARWQKRRIFEKTLEKTKKGKPFVFYDGPPFATGTPHYGHLTTSAIKDAIPRYRTMRGNFVERRWGWDCHGLPIEEIVERELGTKTKKEIEEMGIGKFNARCREKIFSYVDVWNEFIPRFGRWADMKNPYTTMSASYMESEWWAFRRLYDQGLLYEDYRSMHICPRCETTLAQAEVAEGYAAIKDIAATVKFPVSGEKNTFFLAWTTTPWTLPGNVALAVGENIGYVKARIGDEFYIVAKERAEETFAGKEYEIAEEMKGADLVGRVYEPPFAEYKDDASLENRENGWKVYAADFVTTESGTGIVHIAPAFGEDDFALGKDHRLPFVRHIGMDGVVEEKIKDLAGMHVKPKGDHQKTDVEIIKILARKNLLFAKEKYEHSYPHCWRCDTPLLNYATSSWFVAVTKIKDKLEEYARGIEWVPAHIKEGRWKDWLAGARDWGVSRQRFWANPVPVWENKETGKRIVIGSVAELLERAEKSGNRYFVVRHGHAESNERGFVAGDKDAPVGLTDRGEREARAAGARLKEAGVTKLFVSPFVRTRRTAEIIAREAGIAPEDIVIDERLSEINTGVFNGRPVDEYRAFFSSDGEKFTRRPEGGEHLGDVRKRVLSLLFEIEERMKNESVAFVTHEYPAWMLIAGSRMADDAAALAMKEKDGDGDFPNTGEVVEIGFAPFPHNENYELDLHRPHIDRVKIRDEEGLVYERVPDVLDTWFDSGSVPFSSYHYPFENDSLVESRIPADFIGEGQDQVSKWFYYQHVLAGALFGKRAFSHVIVNGIVLAEDGKKMSKRLRNYPDPSHIINTYGADAVRLYILSSPVVRAENFSFTEPGVDEVHKKIILRLRNVVSFYEMYAAAGKGGGEDEKKSAAGEACAAHPLDAWMRARTRELAREVTRAMERYELDRAVRPFFDFVDDFSAWYIRRSRDRFKKGGADAAAAAATTRETILSCARLIAPFAPFIADDMYLRAGGTEESVHLESWPDDLPREEDEEILRAMKEARKVVSAGLQERVREGIKVRQPLSAIILKEKPRLSEELLHIIKDELNVKEVRIDANISGNVALDTRITEELAREGMARECVRRIQLLRKKGGFSPDDTILLFVSAKDGGEVRAALEDFPVYVREAARAKDISFGAVPAEAETDSFTLGGEEVHIGIMRP